MVLANDFGTGQVFWSLLMFFLFVIWIWLLIVVFSDLFRSRDLSGWAKAAWVIGIIVLPYLGVLLYLIVRGNKIGQHARRTPRPRTRPPGPTSSRLPARHQAPRTSCSAWPT